MANHKHAIRATCFDAAGKIISTAENNYNKTHPKQAAYAILAGRRDPEYNKRCMYRGLIHAEVLAIIRARKPIHRIKIERYNKQGLARLAKPCLACEIAIAEAKIKLVEYTVSEQ